MLDKTPDHESMRPIVMDDGSLNPAEPGTAKSGDDAVERFR